MFLNSPGGFCSCNLLLYSSVSRGTSVYSGTGVCVPWIGDYVCPVVRYVDLHWPRGLSGQFLVWSASINLFLLHNLGVRSTYSRLTRRDAYFFVTDGYSSIRHASIASPLTHDIRIWVLVTQTYSSGFIRRKFSQIVAFTSWRTEILHLPHCLDLNIVTLLTAVGQLFHNAVPFLQPAVVTALY